MFAANGLTGFETRQAAGSVCVAVREERALTVELGDWQSSGSTFTAGAVGFLYVDKGDQPHSNGDLQRKKRKEISERVASFISRGI